MKMKIEAKDLKAGDSIPGLSDAYVADVDSADDMFAIYDGRIAVGGLIDDHIGITVHDGMGEESYLILHPEFPLEIDRP